MHCAGGSLQLASIGEAHEVHCTESDLEGARDGPCLAQLQQRTTTLTIGPTHTEEEAIQGSLEAQQVSW